jgi:hypothetical protein
MAGGEGSPWELPEGEESLRKAPWVSSAQLGIELTGLTSLEPARQSIGGLPSLGSKFKDWKERGEVSRNHAMA